MSPGLNDWQAEFFFVNCDIRISEPIDDLFCSLINGCRSRPTSLSVPYETSLFWKFMSIGCIVIGINMEISYANKIKQFIPTHVCGEFRRRTSHWFKILPMSLKYEPSYHPAQNHPQSHFIQIHHSIFISITTPITISSPPVNSSISLAVRSSHPKAEDCNWRQQQW